MAIARVIAATGINRHLPRDRPKSADQAVNAYGDRPSSNGRQIRACPRLNRRGRDLSLELSTPNVCLAENSRTRKHVMSATLPTPASGSLAVRYRFLRETVLSAPTLPSKTKSKRLRIRRGCVFFLASPAYCLKTVHAAATRTLCKTTLGLLTEAIP